MQADAFAVQRIARISIVCLAILPAAPAAAADDYGWLAAVSAGAAKLQDFRLPTTSSDDTGTVASLYGGYQFTRHFSLAGGYVDLGKYSFQGPSFGGYVADIKVDGVHFYGAGNLPVSERVGLVGTLGAYWWNYKYHDLDVPTGQQRNLSDTGVSPTVGLGVNIDIFSLRGTYLQVSWQRFFKVGKRETVEHENDYDLLVVGIMYNFSKLAEGKY